MDYHSYKIEFIGIIHMEKNMAGFWQFDVPPREKHVFAI
jgi:hypothetical protein